MQCKIIFSLVSRRGRAKLPTHQHVNSRSRSSLRPSVTGSQSPLSAVSIPMWAPFSSSWQYYFPFLRPQRDALGSGMIGQDTPLPVQTD